MISLYLDEVVTAFDEHLNATRPWIEGLAPADVLINVPSKYEKLLEEFIQENYLQYQNNEETLFLRRNNDA